MVKNMKRFNPVLIAVLLLMSQSVFASGLRWLNYSAVRYFTDQDWNMLTESGRKALNDSKDGQSVSWKNATSGNHGSLTPLSTSKQRGTTCRKLKISNHARGMSGSSTYTFCKNAAGKWDAIKGN
jgi:surface antigen